MKSEGHHSKDGGRLVDGGGPPGVEQSDGSDLSRDTIFFALSNRRRRHVLHYLKQQDGPVRLRDLTEQVAAWENGVPKEGVPSNQRKTVYTSLRQTHLPMLQNAGVVTYDDSIDNISLTPKVQELDVYLEVVPENDLPWSRYYVGLAAVMTALVAAVWADVYPFVLLPDVAYAAIVTVALLVSACAHLYSAQDMRIGGPGSPPEVP